MNPRIISTTTYLAIIITVCDQISKRIIVQSMPVTGIVHITSFLDLNLMVNHGLDFYLFGHDFSGLVSNFFIIFWLVVFLTFSRWRLYIISRLEAVSIGFVMGGIIGDLIDRLRFGTVVNFLDFHIRDFHLYTLNLAECAIAIGMFLLLLDAFIKEEQRDQTLAAQNQHANYHASKEIQK